MPRSASVAASPSRQRRESEGSSISPTVKKAKARLSRLLHRKSSESLGSYSAHDGRPTTSKKAKQSPKPAEGRIQPGRLDGTITPPSHEITWHTLSMISEQNEPVTPAKSRKSDVANFSRPGLGASAYVPSMPNNSRPSSAYPSRPESKKSDALNASDLQPSSAESSKHDSILADCSELCAVPQEEKITNSPRQRTCQPDVESPPLRRMGSLLINRPSEPATNLGPPIQMASLACPDKLPSLTLHTDLRSSRSLHELPANNTWSRSPSRSVSKQLSSDAVSVTSCYSEYTEPGAEVESDPRSPLAPIAPLFEQVKAVDVVNLPDFSFVPNAMRRKHQSDAFVATFRDCSNIITDWQVECFRLRKQMKAVELQLRYKAELLASEQVRADTAEEELEQVKIHLHSVRREMQNTKVSQGIRQQESCALKTEIGNLQVSDQSRHKDLTHKLRNMADRLALEEDAVADKDLRIKWLENEKEELKRENRVLENVKGALWGHIEQARKGGGGIGPASPIAGDVKLLDPNLWF